MKNQNTPLWVIGHRITLIETDGDFDMALAKTPAKTPGPPPHYHDTQSELFFVLNGEMDVMMNGEFFTVRAGESVIVPKHTIHTFNNNSSQDVDWVTTWSPKGFAQFFREFGFNANEEGALLKSVSPETIKAVMEGCHRHGMILQQELAV